MNIKATKIFQSVEMSESMRDKYQALSLSDEQARAIISNATTRICIKQPGHLGTDSDSIRG